MTHTNKTITWGVIGAGDVCEIKSLPAMYRAKNSRVQAVTRRDRRKGEDFIRRHAIPFFYENPDQIFADPEIDIVYIATPPSTHAQYAIRSAEAGKPAYVEKPMAASYKECLQMNEAFESAGLPLFVAYYRRTLPNFLKIKEIIDEGRIGEVRTVNTIMNKEAEPDNVRVLKDNWRVDPGIAGGGYFYDLASHQLDFLDFLFGPVEKAVGLSANQAGLYPAEDVVSGAFSFQNGIQGSGSWCFTTGKSSNTDITTINGSKGKIEYATFGDPTIRLTTDGKGEQIFSFQPEQPVQQQLVNSILNELRGSGRCPSTGISGARTNRIMELLSGKP